MKKRLRMVLLTVIGLGLLILGVALVWPGAGLLNVGGEPTFEGKPSSRWRADLRAELAAGSKESQPVSVSLMRGGAETVPVLVDLLNDDEVKVRRLASQFLQMQFAHGTGPEAVPAVGPLASRLSDEDPLVRYQAVQALGYLGSSARAALPGIIKLLKDPDERVAWAAAWVLGRMGPDAEESLPALREALKDSRALVRKQAGLALESIDPTWKSTSRSYQEK